MVSSPARLGRQEVPLGAASPLQTNGPSLGVPEGQEAGAVRARVAPLRQPAMVTAPTLKLGAGDRGRTRNCQAADQWGQAVDNRSTITKGAGLRSRAFFYGECGGRGTARDRRMVLTNPWLGAHQRSARTVEFEWLSS
jgi:hypothetical protein